MKTIKFVASDEKEYIVIVSHITSLTDSGEHGGTSISLSCGTVLKTLYSVNKVLVMMKD
jgi:hypothetical protein